MQFSLTRVQCEYLLKLSTFLSIVTFKNGCKATAKVNLHEFDVSRIRPRLGGLPHLETLTRQNSTPAGRVNYPVWQTGLPTLAGHPTYHVTMIKLKWEIKWTGGLPYPPGVPTSM